MRNSREFSRNHRHWQMSQVNHQQLWQKEREKLPADPPSLDGSKEKRGWKAVRIYVSSTLPDFHLERESLVKYIFPDLRRWADEQKLRIFECDMRWGVPSDAEGWEMIQICLEELDRCREANLFPYMVNLIGDRCGWIPDNNSLPEDLVSKYSWVNGLSLTAMEMLHGAYRSRSPNAIFAIRSSNSYANVDDETKGVFQDINPTFIEHNKESKAAMLEQFPEQCFQYELDIGTLSKSSKNDQLKAVEAKFSEIASRLKELMMKQYPLDPLPPDPVEAERKTHQLFVDGRSLCVVGREDVFSEMDDYLKPRPEWTQDHLTPADGEVSNSHTNLVLVGLPGAGKSAVMAKKAQECMQEGRKVFFHFVGAAPGSTDIVRLLTRIWKELGPPDEEIPTDELQLARSIPGLLAKAGEQHRVVLFVDALNQLDTDDEAHKLQWLPKILPRNVHLVVSTLRGDCYDNLMIREPKPREILVGNLDEKAREQIVQNYLREYNKSLDPMQMQILVNKEGSENPLWLTTACEELRVFGSFVNLTDKIASLPSGLINLLVQVIERFERENGGSKVIATLCLLECSRHGLMEWELLEMLGNDINIEGPGNLDDTVEIKEGDDEEQKKGGGRMNRMMKGVHRMIEGAAGKKKEAYRGGGESTASGSTKTKEEKEEKKRLATRDWALIFRGLRTFFRPCGDSGEGRLDFFHRAMSKAVRQKYLWDNKVKVWWHGRLATYFEDSQDVTRKAEELPYHLENVLSTSRLVLCLVDWPMFDALNKTESGRLDMLKHWRTAGGYGLAPEAYKQAIESTKEGMSKDELMERYITVGSFLSELGQFDDGDELLQKGVIMKVKKLGEHHPDVGRLWAHVCRVKECRRRTKDYSPDDLLWQMYELSKKAISILEVENLDEDQERLGGSYFLAMQSLALYARHRGPKMSWDRAMDECQHLADRCLEVNQARGDPMAIGESYYAYGVLNYVRRDDLAAFENYQRAYRLWVQERGEKSIHAARALFNMGQTAQNPEEVINYEVECFQIRRDLLGPEHPLTMRIFSRIHRYAAMGILQVNE